MSSLIVDVCEVEEIKPHSNADRVEIIRVKGWEVVSQIGQFKVGDKAVYFPPDTVISEELAEKFGITNYVSELPKNSDGTRPPGRRIRAKKFRGEQSFGFITKPDDASWPVGTSVVDHYGATKYEQVIRDSDGTSAPDLPSFHRYTDIENLKNFPNAFVDGEEVVITEKLHGTNSRLSYVWSDEEQTHIYACGSRTTRKKSPEDGKTANLYWNPLTENVKALLYDLSTDKVNANVILFGEIYGAKIQDLTYGLTTQKFRAFDISVDGAYLDYDELHGLLEAYGVDEVPVLYRGPYSKEIVAQYTDGPTTLCDPGKAGKFGGREGCVVRPVVEKCNQRFGRAIFKSISIDYLERKGGTEFH